MARRIGLFGGTFDPPHVAHLVVAEAAREQAGLDRVLWIPAAASPFKREHSATPADQRLEMVRLAVAPHPNFDACAIEVERGGVSYTVDTVRKLARQFPAASLRLVLGGDSLRSFDQWREPQAIVDIAPLVVYRRPGDRIDISSLPAWLSANLTLVDAPGIELSSTEVRRHLRAGRSARYLVPDAVLEHITARGLYRAEN